MYSVNVSKVPPLYFSDDEIKVLPHLYEDAKTIAQRTGLTEPIAEECITKIFWKLRVVDKTNAILKLSQVGILRE